ncbi:MAG: ATP-binding cassette domain-containing protein, partial [Dehalococcoidia bacterium]|nr:ATP-binding cassette domain-containing protein [Dehalococcoidia bacterium]
MAAFFEVEHLSKRFGGLTAVDDVSFSIDREEMVGLIGPNGSGKTTLVRCITGILSPTSGTVRFKGKDISRWRPWKVVQEGLVGTFQVVKPFRRLPIIA